MKRNLAAIASFAFLIHISTSTAWAGIGFQPVNVDELKMTNEPLAPGASAIILYRQVDRDDTEGQVHEDNYYRIKILTEAGRKYANVEIPFLKGHGVTHILARTIKPDGTIIEFGGDVFEKSLLKSRRARWLTKTFTLPAVEPGCIIEYLYVLHPPYSYSPKWLINEDLFTRSARFSLHPGRVGGSPSIRWDTKNMPPGIEAKQGSDHVIRLELKNIPAFESEDFMPPASEVKWRVDFNYRSDYIDGLEPNLYWAPIAGLSTIEIENFIKKHKATDQALAQIVSPTDPPEVKLRKIYARVQHLRNISLESEKTDEESKRENEKADENVEQVWKRGYGSTTQLNWLFLALARAAGFEADGCWVSNRAEYFFSPKNMQSYQLNESAVLVKLNGQDMYFNPAIPVAPFGMLNWTETNTGGLRLGKDRGTWILTTLPKASESAIQRNAKLKLSQTGDLEGQLTATYTGLQAMAYRLAAWHEDDVARKKMLEDAIKGQIPGTAEVEMISKPDWTDPEKPLVAQFGLKIPNWSSSAGKRMLLPAGVFVAQEKHLFAHATRVHPIYVEYPWQTIDDVTIDLPSGSQVDSTPPPQANDIHIAAYDLKVENGSGSLHMERKLTVDFLLLDAKYYPALRNFFLGVRTGDEQQIVLLPKTANASN